MRQVLNSEDKIINNPQAKVIVNYSIPDPVSGQENSMSGDLHIETNKGSNLALNIQFSRNDNRHLVPDNKVIKYSMTFSDLFDLLRTNERLNKHTEALHINYIDRNRSLNRGSAHDATMVKTSINKRPVGVVCGFSFLRIHHSDDVDGVFVLDLKQ